MSIPASAPVTFDHEVDPVPDIHDTGWHWHQTYMCRICEVSVYWDGVFEGRWFHDVAAQGA